MRVTIYPVCYLATISMLGRPDGLSTPVVLDLNRADEIVSHDVDLFDACVDTIIPWLASIPTPWSWPYWYWFFHYTVCNLQKWGKFKHSSPSVLTLFFIMSPDIFFRNAIMSADIIQPKELVTSSPISLRASASISDCPDGLVSVISVSTLCDNTLPSRT